MSFLGEIESQKYFPSLFRYFNGHIKNLTFFQQTGISYLFFKWNGSINPKNI
jgi:hypothetical protein